MDGYTPSDLVEVILTRLNTGLGFNIRGGIDHPYYKHDTGIFVTKVHPQGAAAIDGRLREGDKIIEINDQSLLNLSHQNAVAKFKASGPQVKLKIIPRLKVYHPVAAPVADRSEEVISEIDMSVPRLVKEPEPKPQVLEPVTETTSEEPVEEQDEESSGGGSYILPGILGVVAIGLIAAFLVKKYQTRV